jgi:tetratricopeptide (TPR) repeat protein
MRGGRRAADTEWMDRELKSELALAADLKRRGRWMDALRLYEAIVRDYPPSAQSRTAAEQAGELRNTSEVRRVQAEARRLAERDLKQAGELQKALGWARSRSDPPAPEELIRKLRVPELQQTIAQGDSLQAASASRLLARTFVWLAFYEPRAYLAAKAPRRALAMFEAAVKIDRSEGESCGLLRSALPSATAEQQAQLGKDCPPE